MKYSKKEFILLAVIVLLGAMSMIVLGSGMYSMSIQEEKTAVYDEKLLTFNSGWILNQNEQKRVKLPCVLETEAMEPVSISAHLPESIVEGTYLRIESVKSYIDVSIDGVSIYSNGEINLGKGGKSSMPMDRWNFVELHPEYSEREITITYRSPYAYFSGILPEVVLGAYSEVILYTYSERNIYVYLGICIMAVGIVMLLIALINTMGDNTLRPGAYLGIFIILMAVMFISQANVPKNYIDGYYKDFLIENVSLRLGLLVWAVYLCVKGSEAIKGWIGLVVLTLGVNFPISLLLHVTGTADYNKTLILPVAAMLILSLLQFYVDVVSKKAGSRRYRMAAGAGITVFLIAFFLGLCSKLQFFLVGNDMLLPSAFLVYSIVMCTAFIIASYDIAAEQVRTSKELNQAKNRLMVSQIQPHFIYNTLNTIRAMTLIEPKRASEVILHFANYLRYNFNALSEQDIAEFSVELKHIREYTSIECERFHRLKVEYEIETVNFFVPPLSVQVFVENAIKHGIGQKEEGGTVTIKSYEKDGDHIVVISDDGAGFDTSILEKEGNNVGIGIKNAVYRLKELADATVDICSEPGEGSQVTILFPEKPEKGDQEA